MYGLFQNKSYKFLLYNLNIDNSDRERDMYTTWSRYLWK